MNRLQPLFVIGLCALPACREVLHPIYDITIIVPKDEAQNPFAQATSVTLQIGGKQESRVAVTPGMPFSLSVKGLRPRRDETAIMVLTAFDAAGKTVAVGATPPLELGLASAPIRIFMQAPGTLAEFPNTLRVPVRGQVFLSPPATGFVNVFPAPVILGGRYTAVDTSIDGGVDGNRDAGANPIGDAGVNDNSDGGGNPDVDGGVAGGTGLSCPLLLHSSSPFAWVWSPAAHSLDAVGSAPLTSARFDSASLVTTAGQIVVFGGSTDDAANPVSGITDVFALQRLDLLTFELIPVRQFAPPDANVPRSGSVAVELAGRVYALGGTAPGAPDSAARALDSVVVIDENSVDPAAGVTLSGATMVVSRSGHSVTRVMGPTGPAALVFGGAPTGTTAAVAEIFSPTGTPPFSPLPGAGPNRSGHIALLLPDGRVLILGGHGDDGVTLADGLLYTPTTGTFVSAGNMLTRPRDAATAFIAGRDLVVVGGRDETGAIASYEVFDAADLSPITVQKAAPRYSARATILPNGTVIVLGGTEYDPGCRIDYASGFVEIYRPRL